MPLVDELVFAKKADPPKYTHDKEQKCDWSIIFEKPSGYDFTFPQGQKLSPIEQFNHLQETMGTSQSLLDETQMLAIKNFLENRVSLIQVIFDVYFLLQFAGWKNRAKLLIHISLKFLFMYNCIFFYGNCNLYTHSSL